MRTLLTMALLTISMTAEAAWPSNQAVLFTAPDCAPCPVLIADLEKCKAVVSPANDAHFILRQAPPELKTVPLIVYFDENGKVTGRHTGYVYTLPYEQRVPELRKIIRKHAMYRPSKPPAAPPADGDNLVASVSSRSAPVRTAELVTLGDDGTVTIPELDASNSQIQLVQYADCSGSQAFGMQSYAMPYSGGGYAPYSDCGGGIGGGGGGGDFFPPPAQSVYAQYAQQRYANPYAASPYTMAYAPRRAPFSGGEGSFNNYSLLSVPLIRPSFSVFGISGLGGLLGQRSYYAPRRLQYRSIAPSSGLMYASYSRPVPYRAAYRPVSRSPFSYVSYGGSGSVVCANGVCYVQ